MTVAELFAWPTALTALILAPLVWVFLGVRDRSRVRRLERMAGPRATALAASTSHGQRRARRILFTAALTLTLVAIAQPAWGIDTRKVEQRGVDLLVCLDVSRSMLARDLPPSRLQRAQSEIRTLSGHAKGARLGLVVFAGDARLAIPLTRDGSSFADLVDLQDPTSVNRGGTDLGAALETALTALEGQTGNHEAVLLITDGEDHEQRGLGVARTCADRNITVHCMGLGSALGSKIAVAGDGAESFLRSRTGDEVVSTLDAEGLRRIAKATGGGYVDAGRSSRPILDLYEAHIRPMSRKAFDADERPERKQHYQWPLLLAFLLWIVESCLTDRSRR